MKKLTKFIALICLTIVFAFTNADKKTIVIDVGHGGRDSGIAMDEYQEKEIALNIASKIKMLNKNPNIEILLTRDTDEFITLDKRTQQINKLNPDFVISLHVNANNDEKENGKEIFVSDKNKQKEKSNDMALKLFCSFNEINVNIKKANFYLLKNVEYPIVLIELGYLTNKNDRKVLTSEKGQTEIAEKILSVLN